MLKYILKRILLMIPVLFGVYFIVFTLTYIAPGDPVVGILGSDYTEEQYQETVQELGLDQPFLVQFFNRVKGVITEFDLGISYQSKRPVAEEVLERFPVTLKLGFLGVLFSIVVGLPAGIISATKQYSLVDYSVTSLTVLFSALPNFWLGLMLMLIFSLRLGWLPASGVDSWKAWIMPMIVNGISPVCIITRLVRSSMLDVIRQDYIQTARAKGMSERVIVRKHALKNALLPVVTSIGVQMGTVLGGSVITESIFAIPGVGSLLVSAISNLNYPTILGCVFFLCIAICILNLIVDVAYAYIDPQIKAQYVSGSSRKVKLRRKEAA